MSKEEPYFFFLPSLFNKGLIKDDRENYSLVSYPRQIISDATKIVVKDYSYRIGSLDTSSKKRIKMISEYLAVALSLPTKDISNMVTAETIYRNWLNNLSMFGSVEMQNRFLRQIFKHLSLPFEFREPSGSEIFDGNFCSLINSIINDYKQSHIKYGSIYEKETWITLLNVVIGITDQLFEFDLKSKFSRSDSSKVRQQLVDLCFSVIQLSGLSDEDIWSNFKKYCLEWNNQIDFIRIWGQYLVTLFSNLNIIAYRQKKSLKFSGGVYSVDNPISEKMVKFLFFNTLSLVDVKIIQEDVSLMNKFAHTMSELVVKSNVVIGSLDYSYLLKRKYPSESFLKLFGPSLTFFPKLDELFDDSVSVIVSTILSIISNFEIDHSSEIVKRLLSFCIVNCSAENVATITSFLKGGSFLFSHNNDILSYVSQTTFKLIQQLYSSKSNGIMIGESLISYLTSIYLSSSEMLLFDQSYQESIAKSFNLIWSNNSFMQSNYQLLCYSYSYSQTLPFIEKILEVVKKISATELNAIDVAYLSSCILLIGTFVRFESMNSSNSLSPIAKSLIDNKIILLLIQMLMKFDYNSKIEEFADLVVSFQQTFINVIEYEPQIFDISDNRLIVCKFIHFIESLNPKFTINEAGMLSKQFWAKVYTKNIAPMNELISYKIASIFPSKDYFSRRLNSCFEINEDAIISKFNIKDPIVNYFAIGQNSLVSFIEPKNHEDKNSFMFIRGQFGKSILQLRDSTRDDFLGAKKPKLSTEIQLTGNSENSSVSEKAAENELFTLDLVPEISMDALNEIDNNVICDYKDQYDTVLDWDKYGFYEPFDKEPQQQIPTASHFLSSMGMMQNNNENEIRIFPDKEDESLQNVIKKLDEVDSLPLLPAVIHHILPCDIYECKSETASIIHNIYINTPDNDSSSQNVVSDDNENEYESYDINNNDESYCNNELINSENDYERFKEQIKFNPEKHPKRMTPALLRFLREIGEPMKISEELHILPPLRSDVPVIPSFHSFIPLISPAMAIDENDAQVIFNKGETFAMKIIFNETDFDIRPPICEKNVKQFILAVSPMHREAGSDSYSLYTVTQLVVPTGIYSPFTEKQTMNAKTLAFYIASIYEQTIKLNSLLLPTQAQKTRRAMAQLTQDEVDSSILGTLALQFHFE